MQNILDLKDTKTLDALRNIQNAIVRMRAQSQLFDDSLPQEPLLHAFFRFVDAMFEVAYAARIMDSSHSLLVQRKDGSNISLDAENFYLTPIKESLQHVQERYGRFDPSTPEKIESLRGNVERIIATTKWLLLKNPLDYLMALEVSRVADSQDFIIKIPKSTQPKILETARKERLMELEEFLMACCHPGRLGVFSAANVQFNNKTKKDHIRVSPTVKMDPHHIEHMHCNPGICLLEKVVQAQEALKTQQVSQAEA